MTKVFNGYFTDRNMEVLGLVSTTNPNALKIVFDEEQESIDKGVTTFTAEVSKHFGLSEGNTTPDLSMVQAGNYFMYEGVDGIAKVFTIIDVTSDSPDEIVSFYAEDGGLDIINEIVGDYEAKDAMVISKYFDLFLKNTGFKIGINELGTTYSRKLKWDGEASVTERLRSVAHQFDHAEINFSFKVKGMRVTQKHVNIYKKRGEETGITLELNRHVNRITATETIANLATSLSPKGSVPENKKDPITLKGHKYDDGRFFVENGFLRDRESNETWSRFLSEGRGAVGGYINKPYTYDTTNVVTLRNSAITELKKVSQVAKNFEVDIAILPDEVRIGDTINIVNQKGELYLEARVLQLTRSRVEDKAVAVLGDYLIKESGINEKLFELSEQMKNIPQGDSSYLWIRYADDDKGTGFSASPVNKSYMAIKTVINQPIPSDNVEDYEGLWVLIQGEGVPGEPGKDGEPTYTWIRYADDVSGGGISDKPEGKMYIGFAHNKPTPTPSDIPKDYAWSAMYDEAKMLELNDKVSVIEEQTNEISESLDLLVVPVMQPDRPIAKEGMVWWKTDVTGDVIGIEKYVGGKWEKQVIQQDTLNIVNLNAVKITGSEITGTEISGSTLISAFDVPIVQGDPQSRRGTLKLDKGDLQNEFEIYNKNDPDVITAKGTVRVSPDGIQTSLFDSQGKLTSASQYSVSGIAINKPSMPYGTVNLGYSDLLSINDTALTASTDWAVYATGGVSQPLASRSQGTITLSGAFKPLKNLPVTGVSDSYVMAVLPPGLRPSKRMESTNAGSGLRKYLLTVFPNGIVEASRNVDLSGYTPFNSGGFYSISCIFTAETV